MVVPFFGSCLNFSVRLNSALTVGLAWLAVAEKGSYACDFIDDKLSILFTTVSRKLDWGANMISNIETMEITKANFNAD